MAKTKALICAVTAQLICACFYKHNKLGFPGVIDDQDGHVEFKLSPDIVNMESHIVQRGELYVYES